MKRFLAIYTGSMDSAGFKSWNAMNEAERKERERLGMEAWMRWGKKHERSIVDGGAPLGKTKCADASGVSDIRNTMAGYVVVEAPSHDAAAQMFVNHPHFAIFPGQSVEIMECLPMPKMAEEAASPAPAQRRSSRTRQSAQR
jgi:hypothetical protein